VRLIPPLHMTDAYKTDHRRQLPPMTSHIYENFVPRSSRIPGIEEIVFFGLQYFLKEYLDYGWNRKFFEQPVDKVVRAYRRRLDHLLGKDAVPMDHVYALHRLGHLPVRICAVPEGTLVPMQVPSFTSESTHDDFAWVPGFLETISSCTVWGPCTSATTAHNYRLMADRFERKTGSAPGMTPYLCHDFSPRGMFGLEAACMSGAAHMLSWQGSDSIPAIDFHEAYYGADCEVDIIGQSIPATEHMVMCAGGKANERETVRRILTEIYPSGPVAVVLDTWNFFHAVTVILSSLRAEIMGRTGKLVVRPDSGDPVKIIVGDPDAPIGSPEHCGLIVLLAEIFGYTTNEKGYKELDSHIGAIYGDSITLGRQREILEGLAAKGFAASCVVLGVGSFSYQYVTRDTFGFAIKATECVVGGETRQIFKDPVTDRAKKSLRGRVRVERDATGRLYARFPVTREEDLRPGNVLQPVFEDGKLLNQVTFREIRERLRLERERILSA